jgi:UDP-galactopyranose mutase
LYYAKRRQHSNVQCFPSSVDANHFAASGAPEPADLRELPHPRLGFYGVIDERFDAQYLREIAALRPDWQFIIVGPVVKINPSSLPRQENIHYIPQRSYAELPAYLEHWDIAMLPFALNDATRFISPTKTLEYLAAGKPTISTPIADVVDPYGALGLVTIVPTPSSFVTAADRLLRYGVSHSWRRNVSRVISDLSWDATAANMERELSRFVKTRAAVPV